MKLTCCKWNAKGNKTVEITPLRIFEDSRGIVSIDVDSGTWGKIRRKCGKDADFGFITEDKKRVEIVGV